MVVGDAVCPCVRDSIGTSAEPSARPVMASVTCTEEEAIVGGASLAQITRAPDLQRGRNAVQGLWTGRAAGVLPGEAVYTEDYAAVKHCMELHMGAVPVSWREEGAL